MNAKCEQYWPDQGASHKNFKPFKVTAVKEEPIADIKGLTMRVLQVNQG